MKGLAHFFMFQSVEEKPRIWLKDLNEHYATFSTSRGIASVRLDNLPQIKKGVYRIKVFSDYCIVDTNIPFTSGGREIEVIS